MKLPTIETKAPVPIDAAVGIPDLELRFATSKDDRYSTAHDVEILRSGGVSLLNRCLSLVLIAVPGDLMRATLTLLDEDAGLRVRDEIKATTQVYNVRFV